jgi:hypothetical protein
MKNNDHLTILQETFFELSNKLSKEDATEMSKVMTIHGLKMENKLLKQLIKSANDLIVYARKTDDQVSNIWISSLKSRIREYDTIINENNELMIKILEIK